jgi:hypothetical protein
MNKTTNVLLGIIVAVAIIGGVYYVTKNKTVESPTPATPTAQVPTSAPTPAPSSEPAVSTKAATLISQSSAVLGADINPNGAQTSYWYEYGKTQSLGSITGAQLLGSGRITYSAPGYVVGLASNTTYYFRAVAENAHGKVTGAIVSFTTTLTPPVPGNPPVIETVSAINISDTKATLRGSVDTKSAATYYWFEYGDTLALGDATSVSTQAAGTNSVAVEKNISGLEANTTYYFRLNAQNGYGTVNGPIRSFTTRTSTPAPAPKGDEPTADTDAATSVARTSAAINGHVNPNGSDTTYWFEYGKASLLGVFDLSQETAEKSAGAGNTAKTFSASLTGLASDTTYYYRIVAKNQYGTDSGSIHQFTTKE